MILINMEMPTSCWLCYFQDCGNCRLNAHKVVDKCIIEDRVDNDCPLVPVPEHGRLIDADALVKLLKRCSEDEWNKEASPFSWSYVYECEMDVVEDMPTIIPASEEGDVAPVRHGRWIKTIGENGVTSACRCNLCGFEDNRYSLFNYCPNCGAKMDGGEE